MLGDVMAYLVISNGREFSESILLLEGEQHEIDRFTSKCIDSDEIRKKKAKEFKTFQQKYPDGKNGSVRFFYLDGDSQGEIKEGFVLYKKHMIAFQEIIRNEAFMLSYVRVERAKVYAADSEFRNHMTGISNYDLKYDLNGMIHHSFNASLNRYIKRLKDCDKQKEGITGGGEKYFALMRTLIIRYNEYIKTRPELPTIDDIYKAHLAKLSGTKLQKTSTPLTDYPSSLDILEGEEPEYVQQRLFQENYNQLHDEYLTREEIESMYVEDPYVFFTSPDFDRYYGGLFRGEHIIVHGNVQNREFYEKWEKICRICFDGMICCPPLGQNIELMNEFDTATLIVLFMTEDNRQLKYQVSRAKQNGTPVVVVSDDQQLIEQYQRLFKDAKIIYNPEGEIAPTRKQIVDAFVQLHNDKYKKVYKK